ncbi:hypothetical protein BDF20DRAFT_833834 [Mycotypha africana]|uniref:uncharacterized protein n=1 Tax=Mycotypha africana TaxID=64632 RepID=UPI0022FFE67D|nr:uncharacterized protein BDF20DRAFT_833834 [Mycotypha africana]KAI8984316.1 hypothetical protein BDF20DRAFT_833834 [Mycotypha africana]
MSLRNSNNSENFIVFGTAFPQQTETDRRAGRSDSGQFVPVWKQEARDEKGRRRFHGAFTGGFTAGYFNTVGSKEGWEPTNYVSSRSARGERREARLEDFMDEEDLEDMANARKIVATEEFDILGGTERELAARKKQQQEESDRGGAMSIIGSSLMDMFGPPKDSVGVKILIKMGWRPGQGIGPRVKRLSTAMDDEDEDEALANDITFAPHDTPIENYQPKRDTYGLGFDIMNAAPEVAEMKRLRELARKEEMDGTASNKRNRSAFGVLEKSGSKSEAFGLGAFEADDDDEDIYKDDFKASNYHSSLFEDEGSMTTDELKRLKRQKRENYVEDTRSNIKCSDGRLPLKGFHVSEKNQHLGKWYPLPQVPVDFNEVHIPTTTDKDGKITKISSDNIFSFEERRHALGEKPIEQRSVFDYIPQHSKDKLDRAISWFLDSGKDKSQLSDFAQVPKDVAQLALKGFIPFGDNPVKQARYKSYLQNQAGLLTPDGVSKTVLPIPEGMTYETGMKELEEFAKAARIFKPLSAMMSGRFTSASNPSKIEVINFEGGLKTEAEYRKEKEQKAKAIAEPEAKPSQEAEAAALKMFGNLTRTVKPFYPNRLVCKRFNVRNPHPDHNPADEKSAGRTQAGSRDVLNKDSIKLMINERMPLNFTSSTTIETSTPVAHDNDPLMGAVIPKPSDRQTANENIKAPVTGVNLTETNTIEEDENTVTAMDYERPSMDIFKAIFENSDTEEEDNDAETEDAVTTAKDKEKAETDTNSDREVLIGPPPPPLPPSALKASDNSQTTNNTETNPMFRPMFKRRQERQGEYSTPLTNIISEEVVIQPFKSRVSGNKRRHVHVSEDDSDNEVEDISDKKRAEKTKSEQSPHRSDSTRHRHHKSGSSRQRDRSKDRDKTKSRSRNRDKDDHKSRKRSRSRERHSRHRSHRHKDKHSKKSSKSKEVDLYDLEDMWVEKEPVFTDDTSTKGKRLTAADMW